MLRRSLRELKIDKARLVEDITRMAMEEITKRENAQPQTRRYEREIELLKKKKERVLDAFFSGNISKEEMRMMSRKYDALTETAVQKLNSVVRGSPPRGAAISEEEVRAEAAAIAEGGKAGDIFLRRMIGSIVVFKDGSCELRLNSLEQTWDYLIGPAKKSGGVI
jgi:predicted  nucleic acid-binding Zn-ribbon protein